MKSANGWPASEDQAKIKIKHFPVKGTKIRLRCAAIAGPILAAFAADFDAEVEPLEEGAFDDWSYAFRDVRGNTGTLSNHSSGTALDLNSAKHPLGKSNTFKPKQIVTIKALCKKYQLVWGGSWKRPDDMHFEISTTKAQVKKLTKQLGL